MDKCAVVGRNRNGRKIEKYKKYRKVRARKILFDFLKKRQYNYKKRVASKRKSSLPATRFCFAKSKYRHEKVCSVSA